MIVVKVVGGLGNQMFQYALGRALALKHDTTLKLDLAWFQGPPKPPWDSRTYDLDCFDLKATFAKPRDVPPQPKAGSRWGASRSWLWERRRGIRIIQERGHEFHPEILHAPDNSYLVGWWQTDKYFQGIEEVIREDFTFRPPLRGQSEELANAILTSEAVSVHFRRGDYVTPRGKKVFGTPSISYYQEAVHQISMNASSPHVFVFSDDPDWCRQNVVFDHETTFVGGTPERGPDDMHLMTLCKYHVIANSSFSWWGAWLCRHPDKRVFAPRLWYLDRSLNTKDAIPPDWVRL